MNLRCKQKGSLISSSHLDKTNGGRFFTETLSAKVKAVFANETGLVCA